MSSTMKSNPHPSTVGNSFVKQYYHLLAKSPETLHRFYKDDSKYTHGVGSLQEEAISGQKQINDKIMSMGFHGARVDLESGSVDCQASIDGGVVVMVAGIITLKGQESKAFTQTFFLAVQPNGYFVLNDLFRYLETPNHLKPTTASLKTSSTQVTTEIVTKEEETENEVECSSEEMVEDDDDLGEEEVVEDNKEYEDNSQSTEAPDAESPVVNNKTATFSQDRSQPRSWASHLFSGPPGSVSPPPGPASSAPAPPRKVPTSRPTPSSDANEVTPPTETIKERIGRYFSIFCKDVPLHTKESEIRDLFKEFGAIANVNILPGKGYVFVDYFEQESVKNTLADGRQFSIHDKVIHVEERHQERKEGQRVSNGNYRDGRVNNRSGRNVRRNDRRDRPKEEGCQVDSSSNGVASRNEKPRDKTSRRGGRVDGGNRRNE